MLVLLHMLARILTTRDLGVVDEMAKIHRSIVPFKIFCARAEGRLIKAGAKNKK